MHRRKWKKLKNLTIFVDNLLEIVFRVEGVEVCDTTLIFGFQNIVQAQSGSVFIELVVFPFSHPWMKIVYKAKSSFFEHHFAGKLCPKEVITATLILPPWTLVIEANRGRQSSAYPGSSSVGKRFVPWPSRTCRVGSWAHLGSSSAWGWSWGSVWSSPCPPGTSSLPTPTLRAPSEARPPQFCPCPSRKSADPDPGLYWNLAIKKETIYSQ